MKFSSLYPDRKILRWYGDTEEGGFNYSKAPRKLGPPAEMPPSPARPHPSQRSSRTTLSSTRRSSTILSDSKWMDLEQEARYQAERIRHKALDKLWEGVINELEFRHPDPRVKVTCSLGSSVLFGPERPNGGVVGRFTMHNMRDTRNPEEVLHSGLSMAWATLGWPGKKCAATFLTGAWMFYVFHETSELVSWKSKINRPIPEDMKRTYFGNPARHTHPDHSRVFDVHNPATHGRRQHWDLMERLGNFAGSISVQDFLASFVMDAVSAAGLIRMEEAQAAAELEAKIRLFTAPQEAA